MRSAPITATLFKKNRSKLAKRMATRSILLLPSNEQMPRNGDQFYPYRQGSDFFYLTGISQEGCVLVLSPDHPDPELREVLFIRRQDPKTALWTGPLLNPSIAKALSGINQIRFLDETDTVLEKIGAGVSLIYLNDADREGNTGRPSIRENHLIDRFLARQQEAGISPLSQLMLDLRMIKEFEEVEQIRKASEITRSAFQKVLAALKPGIREYEIEAEITAEFLRRGSEGPAYEPIVASGKNALILHYTENSGLCEAGSLLLLDFGASVNYYAADCSRTIPVNGKFSPRQRELYDAVVRVFINARDWMQAGIKMSDYHLRVGELWEEEHIKLGLYSVDEARAAKSTNPLWKKYFMHGTSHSLGLDVHDPFDRSVPFEPGMVLTCEPAIYIQEEEVGIRLENDILITENGPVDLMEDIPMDAEEIELAMQQNVI